MNPNWASSLSVPKLVIENMTRQLAPSHFEENGSPVHYGKQNTPDHYYQPTRHLTAPWQSVQRRQCGK